MAPAIPPAGNVQCGPSKETGRIEYERNDDQGDESEGCIPDDIPHHADIGPFDHTQQQCHQGAAKGTPTNTQIFGLPDHQYQGDHKNSESQHEMTCYSERALVYAPGYFCRAFDSFGISISEIT